MVDRKDRLQNYFDTPEELIKSAKMHMEYFLESSSESLNQRGADYPFYMVKKYDAETDSYVEVCTFGSYERVMKIKNLL